MARSDVASGIVKSSRTKVRFTALYVEMTDGKVTAHKSLNFGVCRECGCTDFDCSQCIARTGRPCSWTDESHTLCSACR